MLRGPGDRRVRARVSVLFNEPKLLKFRDVIKMMKYYSSFSALQRAEIAEIQPDRTSIQ